MSTRLHPPILHHFVYGFLEDYLTGEERIDTDDERIRQEIARFLVEKKEYSKFELTPRLPISTTFNGKTVISTIDFTIEVNSIQFLIIRYAPGSLVSRERSAIAAARLLNSRYQIPRAVVTNGRDAEIIDTATGKIIANGLESIPDRFQVEDYITALAFPPCPTAEKLEREMRILNVFDEERCCLKK